MRLVHALSAVRECKFVSAGTGLNPRAMNFAKITRKRGRRSLRPLALEIFTSPASSRISSDTSVSILISRLLVVALLAQRLPVAPIPEELRVSSVRNDVIHNGCRRCNAFPQDTPDKEDEAARTSCSPVSTSRCILSMLPTGSPPGAVPYALTVLLSCWHEVWTPRMPAGDHWFVWHVHHLRFP
jgi:hypothetical protein